MVWSKPGAASGLFTWAAECAGLIRRFGLAPDPDLNLDSIPPSSPAIASVDADIDVTKPAVASLRAGRNPHRNGRDPDFVAKIRTGDTSGPLRRRTGKRRSDPETPVPPPQLPGKRPSNPLPWSHHLTTSHPFSLFLPILPWPLDELTTLPLPLDPTRFLLTTLTSITLNHLRRTLHPALAAPVYHAPLEDLRIARSNPAHFLEEALSVSWITLAVSYLQKAAWDFVGGLLLSFLSLSGGRGAGRGRAVVIGVVYLVWMLASVEYVFMRSCSAVAFAVAGWKLGFGAEVGRRALEGVLERRWDKGVVVGLEAGWWVWWGLVPLGRESLRAAVDGRPGMLLVMVGVVGVVVAVLEWRSVLFIALEVSGVFIAGGYFVVVVGVWLGGEREGEVVKMARPDSVVERRTPTTTGMTRTRRGARHGQVRHQKVE